MWIFFFMSLLARKYRIFWINLPLSFEFVFFLKWWSLLLLTSNRKFFQCASAKVKMAENWPVLTFASMIEVCAWHVTMETVSTRSRCYLIGWCMLLQDRAKEAARWYATWRLKHTVLSSAPFDWSVRAPVNLKIWYADTWYSPSVRASVTLRHFTRAPFLFLRWLQTRMICFCNIAEVLIIFELQSWISDKTFGWRVPPTIKLKTKYSHFFYEPETLKLCCTLLSLRHA